MNYEKIILEMLSRIKDLEEKVDMLQDYLQNKDEDESKIDSLTNKPAKESGRTRTRKEIMKILKDKFGYSARIGNRAEGSGIVANKNGEGFNIKVSYSRSYISDDEILCSGWHTLFESEINKDAFKYFIFVVEDDESQLHYFIFKSEDLINEFEDKEYDANKKLHFYFRLKYDGSPIEARDMDKDMRAYYNNWEIFK